MSHCGRYTRLLADLDREGLAVGSVVIVDEAGMLGGRALHRLLTHTQTARSWWCWSGTTVSSPSSPPAARSGPWPASQEQVQLVG